MKAGKPMKLDDPQSMASLMARLKRIEGQLRGVQSMLEQGRDCREVLQQLTAIRSAVHSASLYYFEEAANHCIHHLEEQAQPERQQVLQDMVAILSKQ